VDVLDVFSIENPELGVLEISRRLNLGTSTVYRVLNSLKKAGLVRQADNQKYSLGYKMLKYARIIQLQLRYQELIIPIFRRMREQCNETMAFHLFDGNSRICLFQLESNHQLRRTYTDVGEPLPLYPGSPGKVILASLLEEVREKHIRSFNLSQEQEKKLRAEIADYQRLGYATSHSERTEGISSLAAPVFDGNKNIVGVVNISGPTTRMGSEEIQAYSPLLLAMTREISVELGYRE
jgi:DNA-binding IclR family transcriptional regulator